VVQRQHWPENDDKARGTWWSMSGEIHPERKQELSFVVSEINPEMESSDSGVVLLLLRSLVKKIHIIKREKTQGVMWKPQKIL
jgi:hypothetical protein